MHSPVSIVLMSLILMVGATPPGFSKDSGGTGAFVTESVEVNASPKAVWEAIKKHRKVTPGRKLLSYSNNQATMSEDFDNLPVIGKANIVYVEHEKPMSEIEYSMVRSDKIKAFDGRWKLIPTADGKHTTLQLSSRTDTGIHIPFSGSITRKTTKKNVEKRLAQVKSLAESIASSSSSM